MARILNITLDLYNENRTVYKSKQSDTNSRFLLATITELGVPFSIPSNNTVYLKVRKPDQTRTLTKGVISDGKVLVELTSQTLAVPGIAYCEIRILQNDPIEDLKTIKFKMLFDSSVFLDEIVESTDEFTALEEALAAAGSIGHTSELTTEAKIVVPAINELNAGKEDKSNKVVAIDETSTDTQYPSAKLVYDQLDLKEDKSNKVTSIDSESTDTQYPSAKLTYDQLALKEPNLPVTPLIPAEKFLNGNKAWATPAHNKITDLNTDENYQHITTTQVSKLTNIEENAEVNIIETVSIDGADITPDANRNIDIPLATSTNDGAMSSEYAEKLDGIAENANNYVHPTTAGNKHIPAGGSVGKILKWSADGTASWEEESSGGGGSGKKYCKFVVGTSTSGYTLDDVDYLCDGTEDQAEINAAITALPTGGGEIIILDGTYNITAKINLNKSNVTISGNGNSTILKRMYNSSSMSLDGVISLTSANYCKIKDLQIDGNKAVYTSSNNSGIYLNSSSNNIVTGNICNNNNRGIYLDSSCNDNIVTGNNCNGNTNGINLYSSCNNNTVTGNTCNGNTNSGIYLNSSSNNIVTGNTCNNNTNYGISLSSSSNNTITGNTCNGNTNSGILLGASSNNIVTGNTCNNDNRGIYVFFGSNNNTITGNTCIRGTGLPANYTTGQDTIRLDGTANNYNLIAINNCMGKAVVVGGGTGNSVYGNKWDAGNDLP